MNKIKINTRKISILHIAPERSISPLLRRMENIHYVTADACVSLVPIVGVKPDRVTDLTDLCFESDSFDGIVCIHVLEHVQDDKKAMIELKRVLKPGGWAILQVPIDLHRDSTLEDPNIKSDSDRIKYYGETCHVRLYGKDYKDRLSSAGFVVQVDSYVKALSETVTERYRLDMDEDVYLCRKPCHADYVTYQ